MNCRYNTNVFVYCLNSDIKLMFLHIQQNMEEMEKSHDAFLQGAQQDLKKEMAILQKKILIDTVGLIHEAVANLRSYLHIQHLCTKHMVNILKF